MTTPHPENTRRNFDRAAHRYDAHAQLQHQQVEQLLALAQQHVPAIAQVVDVGCGTGSFAALAKPMRPGWHITGVDIAPAMLAKAKTRCDAVFHADATQLPLGDASVEATVSSLCIQWVQDKAAMLAEMKRVLKPGGVAMVITLGDATLEELRAAAAASYAPLGLLPMLPFETYRTLAEQSGMELLACHQMREQWHYPSVEALLGSMRAIGAGNAGEKRFIAPRTFARLIQQYEASYGTERGIVATWQPITLVLRKR